MLRRWVRENGEVEKNHKAAKVIRQQLGWFTLT
jgi:hypothetical protein